jgi:hypothetical protein
MPTIKKNRQKYQHEYYLKNKKGFEMYCDCCEKSVYFYLKHCQTIRHKQNQIMYNDKLLGKE